MTGQDEIRPPLTDRLTSRQWLVIDCVVAVLAAGILWVSVGLHGFRYHAPPPGAAVFAVLATAPVAVRRIWPVPVFAVVLVASSVVVGGRPGFRGDGPDLVHGGVPGRRCVARGRLHWPFCC